MDEEKTSTALIAVTRLPEIKENLRSLRERWEQKARATIEASTGFFIVSTTVKLIIVNKYIPIGLCKITELLI